MTFKQPRDWSKIDEILSCIPFEGERLMTFEEVQVFYEKAVV